ncbi:MAG: GntR family transcriptional regulator [Spirochaetota bacterium]
MLAQTSARPLYEQLKQTLVGEIIAGIYHNGDRLPGEMGLAGKYGISRITVRRALSELVEEGYLSSQQGRGTFVNYKPDEQKLRSFGGFSESFDGTRNKTSRILAMVSIAAEPVLAAKLEIQTGDNVWHLRRVMYEDDRPYMLDNAYFIQSMYPGLPDLIHDNTSTFSVMWHHYGMVFAKADKTIGAVRAGSEESRLLECVPGDPLLSITKVIYDRQVRPIHYSHYFVLGDRCIYTMTVVGEQSDLELHYQQNSG